jgi:hypothetical protein
MDTDQTANEVVIFITVFDSGRVALRSSASWLEFPVIQDIHGPRVLNSLVLLIKHFISDDVGICPKYKGKGCRGPDLNR